jgi:hypothetical protein
MKKYEWHFHVYHKKRNPVQGDFHHISEVIDQGMPVVMFDRVPMKFSVTK